MTHGDETGWREQPAPTRVARRTQYADLCTRAWRLGEQYALTDEHPCCALAKRRLRHQDELFQFVVVPGLPADNNLAERSIRPLVIMRKISGGTRSAEGTETRLTLASLLRTGAARNLNPFLECYAPLRPPTATAPPQTSLPERRTLTNANRFDFSARRGYSGCAIRWT